MRGDQINVRVSIPNTESRNRVGPNRPLTFEELVSWIKSQGFDADTESGLIELASTYPHSALKSFKRNIHIMVSRVKEKIKSQLKSVNITSQSDENQAEEGASEEYSLIEEPGDKESDE